jgi:lambda repressor-like predicted transcriptional regulator
MKEEQRREVIREYLLAHPGYLNSDVVRYFNELGFKKRTVYEVISRLAGGGDVHRKPGIGEKATGLTGEVKHQIIEAAAGKVGFSFRSLGKQFGFHHKTVKNILKEANIERKSRRVAPASDEKQKQKQKSILRKLRDSLFRADNDSISIIMDDGME